jgi:membrane protease YdiL (CAAX protease family)
MNEEISQKTPDLLSVKQILTVTIPFLLIYCILGMPTVGNYVLKYFNLDDRAIDIGQHLWNFFAAFLFLLVCPALIIAKKWKIPFNSIGTQKGNYKLGIILLLVSLIAIPLLYIGTNDPELIAEYPLSKETLTPWYFFVFYELLYGFFYYMSYEFYFRGLMQIGLNKHWKKWQGILFVTIITTFIHWIPMNKPISEIIGAFAVGFVFGYLAEKTESWYYIFGIHYFIGIITDTFCGMRYLGII